MVGALAVVAVLVMPQPFGPLDPASHEIWLGVPRSGKTFHARERLASARRVVFFDPTGGDYTSEGEQVSAADLEADPRLLVGSVVRLVVVPGDDVAEDFRRTVAACRAAKNAGGLVLCADEVGDYSKHCEAELTKLHRNGHHAGVASVLVSQCAVDIPRTCRRTATRVASLLQVDAGDLEALSEPPLGPAFAERVRTWQAGDPPVVWTLPTLFPTTR
jgi:hypothetical protein